MSTTLSAQPTAVPLAVGRALRRACRLWTSELRNAAPIWAAAAALSALAEGLEAGARLSAFDRSQLAAPVQVTAGLVASVAVARLYFSRALGRPAGLAQSLGFAARRWPTAAAVSVISSLAIGLGLLLFAVPGIAAALNLSLATPLLAGTRHDANQVLRRSRAIAFGARWRLALTLAAAGAPSLALWAVSALVPEPAQFALRFAVELVGAGLEGLWIAGQIACFTLLVEDRDRARLTGPLATG